MPGNVSTQSVSAVGSGTYNVIITDTNGCSSPPIPVTVVDPPQLNAGVMAIPTPCSPLMFGQVRATSTATFPVTTGGTGSYSFSWSGDAPVGGSSAGVITGVGIGVYSVVVTDQNGCTSSATDTVTEYAPISFTVSHTDETCFGANDGTASIQVTSGTATYEWHLPGGSEYTPTVSNLAAGTYQVDYSENGCVVTQYVTIGSPTQIIPNVVVTSDYNGVEVSCFGACDGSATSNQLVEQEVILISGIQLLFSKHHRQLIYVLIHHLPLQMQMDVKPQTTVNLQEPAALTASAAITSNYNGEAISCNGATDGEASVSISGGTGTLVPTWSPAPGAGTVNSTTALGLGAQTYTATIQDVNGCTAISNGVTLTEPAALSIQNTTVTDASCNGANDGSISVTVAGGTIVGGNYSYNWSPSGGNASTTTPLGAGTYTVTVNDDNGCSVQGTGTISQLPPAPTSIAISANPSTTSCIGQPAVLSITTTLNQGNIQWWQNTGSGWVSHSGQGNSITVNTDGDYYAQVTFCDASVVTSNTISYSSFTAATATVVQPSNCTCDGTITWSNLPTGTTAQLLDVYGNVVNLGSNLCSGEYHLISSSTTNSCQHDETIYLGTHGVTPQYVTNLTMANLPATSTVNSPIVVTGTFHVPIAGFGTAITNHHIIVDHHATMVVDGKTRFSRYRGHFLQ